MQPVKSTALTAIGYDANHRWLDIEFKHGGLYRYLGVPAHDYDGLLSSSSKGAFFRKRIQDRYVATVLRRPEPT
jgi:hypothetical protein